MRTAIFCAVAAAFFLPYYREVEYTGDNLFTISLNGKEVGVVEDLLEAEDWLQQVRRQVASEAANEEGGLVFADVEMTVKGQEVLVGEVSPKEEVIANMHAIVKDSIRETMQHAYVVKVNDYIVNVRSVEEVRDLLQAAVDQYDTEGRFRVQLVHDANREFNVLTAQIAAVRETESGQADSREDVMLSGGMQGRLFSMFEDVEPVGEKTFADYELGLQSMNFAEEVEIVEAYLDASRITPLETAIQEVTKIQEVNTVYTVQAGDTLFGISLEVDIPMDKLVEMNDSLKDENTIIHIGQELIITVPEPELSVERQEQVYYEENYEADIVYIDRDDWYTTQSRTVQEPSAGFRKVVALVSYYNNTETGREIVKEEVVAEAVPKIVERGTKSPPTYIKPISGGRRTSGFGPRKAPVKGASTYHKGVDWAVPTGTRVNAASGGVVTKAGWASGGGYVVYIDHGNGSQTRYKHLSKILVKVGQKVSQGQQIAKSGNTGVTSGPHLHFEIWINGTAVNPEKYLK